MEEKFKKNLLWGAPTNTTFLEGNSPEATRIRFLKRHMDIEAPPRRGILLKSPNINPPREVENIPHYI